MDFETVAGASEPEVVIGCDVGAKQKRWYVHYVRIAVVNLRLLQAFWEATEIEKIENEKKMNLEVTVRE